VLGLIRSVGTATVARITKENWLKRFVNGTIGGMTDHVECVAPRRRRLGERNRSVVAILLAAFSTITSLAGMVALAAFDNAPGAASTSPALWPRLTGLDRSTAGPQLLAFAHPYCSCTTATISELGTLFASLPLQNAPAVTFVVYRPGSAAGWSWKTLKDRASVLAHSRFVWDDGGLEARRFGATTSGMVLLYSSAGQLQFQGGITGSRGHEGDNYGLDTLRMALRHMPNAMAVRGPISRSRVFGCALGSFESKSSSLADWFVVIGQELTNIIRRNS
jgi:hypothetical protein